MYTHLGSCRESMAGERWCLLDYRARCETVICPTRTLGFFRCTHEECTIPLCNNIREQRMTGYEPLQLRHWHQPVVEPSLYKYVAS